jgi:hypothetical protein
VNGIAPDRSRKSQRADAGKQLKSAIANNIQLRSNPCLCQVPREICWVPAGYGEIVACHKRV